MLRTRKILGVAIEERSFLVAETRRTGDHFEVRHTAEFAFPQGTSLESPAELGKAFAQFLRKNGLSARRAVIGLPARWLMARREEVPPARPDLLAGMLMLRAERGFTTEVADLALDYVGDGAPEHGGSVLLIGTLRRRLDQVLAMARAATLKVVSVTASATSLAEVTAEGDSRPSLLLYASPDGVEMVGQAAGSVRLLRHLSAGPAAEPATSERWLAGLGDQVRRMLALLPDTESNRRPERLLVWDGIGLDRTRLKTMGEGLSLPVTVCEGLRGLGSNGQAGPPSAPRFAAAVALGVCGARPEPLAVDFLGSHLSRHRKAPPAKAMVWAGALLATLVVAAVALVADWRGTARDLREYNAKLDGMQQGVAAAEAVVARVSGARRWYDKRPPLLDCLRTLTLAFPEEGRIWVSSLGVNKDMRVSVVGKALDEGAVQDVLDKLQKTHAISDLKIGNVRKSGPRSEEVSFDISFTFVGEDQRK
jgi:hypothetical protein